MRVDNDSVYVHQVSILKIRLFKW